MDLLTLRHRNIGQLHITSFAYIQKKEEWIKKKYLIAAHMLFAVPMYLRVS